ncbi:MAG: hypothetical protein DME34_07610 [Verrucomicrobia bacterium]|nr:MAG: hypothetical protein DME34_07610 [Verrucomicrobiota bacterium]
MRDSDLLLTAEELRLKRRRRRRWIVLVLLIVIAIPAGYFGARPARDQIKAWQGRRHAQRAGPRRATKRWLRFNSAATSRRQSARWRDFSPAPVSPMRSNFGRSLARSTS